MPSKPRVIEVPSEIPGESMFLSMRVYDRINKKLCKSVNITRQYAVGGARGKLVVEYTAKKGKGFGKIELYGLDGVTQKII